MKEWPVFFKPIDLHDILGCRKSKQSSSPMKGSSKSQHKLKQSPKKRNLQDCSVPDLKSHSFDEHEEELENGGDDQDVVLRVRNKSRSDMEAKRRSLYQKDCKGRSKALNSCQECKDVALEVKDIQLNEEIFHIPSPPVQRKADAAAAADAVSITKHKNEASLGMFVRYILK